MKKFIAIILLSVVFLTAHAIGQLSYFYSKPGGNLDLLSTWGSNPDGSGTAPGNFTDSNQVFIIRNDTAPAISGDWTVSGAHSEVIVDTNSTFGTGAHTFTSPDVTIINGAFQIDEGGGATGSAFTYGSSGTLIFNTTSGWYAVGSSAVFWPPTSGPVNVAVTGGNIEIQTTRTVPGRFQTSGGVRRSASGDDLIISGALQMNKGGYFTGFSPTYTGSATLIYSIHGQITQGTEWNTGAYVGYGVPQNLIIRNHTRLDMQGGYWRIPGNITLTGAGDTLASYPTSTDIYIGGNWTRNDSAVYLALGGGIFFDGVTDQIITAAGGEVFDYLGINNYGATVDLACNVTVTTMIFLTNGEIVTGADTLFLPQGGQTTVGNAYVIGNYVKYFDVGATVETFEVGDLTGYRPVTVAFGNVTTGGNIFGTVTQSGGDHPNFSTSGLNPSKSVNRYWTLKNIGVGFDTYSAIFSYLPGDLDNGTDTNKLVVRKFDSPTWGSTATGARTGTTIQATGLTSFSDFAVGEQQIDHYTVNAVSPQVAGVPFSTTVTAMDLLNQTVLTDNSTAVTMSGSGNVHFDSNGDGVYGDNAKTLTAGSFAISTRDTTAQTISLTTTDGNGKTGSLTGVVINPATAIKLVFSQQPSNAVAGSPIVPAITVQIEDTDGNVVTADTRNITLSIGTNPGGGSFSGTTTVAAVGGIATFTDLSINKTGTGYTLTSASSPPLMGGTSTPFNIAPATPAKLVFDQQPTSTASGALIAPAITVEIKDVYDNVVTNDTRNVSVAIGTNPGGGTLSGGLSVDAVAGVATFSNLSIDKVGTGYTLSATSSPVLTGVLSTGFDITPGPLHHFAIATISNPQIATISFPVTISAQDVNNNTVIGFTGTVNLSANSGTITPTVSGAFTGGTWSESVTLTLAGTGRTISVDDGAGHTGTSNPISLNKEGTTGILSAVPNPSIYNQPVTFRDSVHGSHPDEGKVFLRIDGIVVDSALLTGDGTVEFVKSNLKVGNYQIIAFYAGSYNFDTSSSNTVNEVVNFITTTTQLVSDLNPSQYSQSIGLTATVNGGDVFPTGKVVLLEGPAQIDSATLNGSGVALFSVSKLKTGSHSLTAEYIGDTAHGGSVSNLVTQIVNKEPTTSNLVSLDNPGTYGQAVTLHDSISGSVPDSGTVQFMDSVTSLGSPVTIDSLGRANLSIASLNAGTHAITAVYSGSSNFLASTSGVVHQVVIQKPTTSVLTVLPSSVYTGQSVTFNDSVSGPFADSGMVQFKDGAAPLGSPVPLGSDNRASLTTSSLSAGTHQIAALYLGTINFASSTSNLLNIVIKDSDRYRSFDPDSIAASVDNKGKMGKAVARKNTRVYFVARCTNPVSGVDGLHIEFGAGIDTSLGFFTNLPSSKVVLDSYFKKWTFSFGGPLTTGTDIRVYGFGKTGNTQKVLKYYWLTGGTKTGAFLKNPPFETNQPRMSMPNRINVLAETYRLNGYARDGGILLGENRKSPVDSSRQYGWLLAKKSGNALSSLHDKSGYQTGSARGFDIFTVSKRPLIRQQSALSPSRENNVLVADMIALKMNIAASALGITPTGFGELVFRDTVDNVLNNMMVKDIAHYMDSVIMGYYKGGIHTFIDTSLFRILHETVRRIDDAFEGKPDTIRFADTLRMPGTIRLGDVAFLHSNPGVIPHVITPSVNPVGDLPDAFALYQNYPNPFNPTTTIDFDLQYPSTVTVKIFNILGQEVATLINGEMMNEGKQVIRFNGSGYASGVYFYRFVAHPAAAADGSAPVNDITLVKRMVLLK